MNVQNLKKAMEHIQITEQMQKEVIANIHQQMADNRHKRPDWKRCAASAAAILLAIGIVSVPVSAGIRYLVRARMEQIPKEELSDTAEMIQEQSAAADGFSRAYTDQEQTRMGELSKAYQNGTFPSGQLLQVPDESQILSDMLCYSEDTSTFYLPDRELTDEELLQIIDFNYKRDYSLKQSDEVQAEKALREEKEAELKALVEAGGGITEAEAFQIAKEQLKAILDVDTEGMEEYCCLDSEQMGGPAYCITFSIPGRCYYSISVNAADQTIMYLSQNDESWPDGNTVQPMEEQQALEELDTLYQDAQDFLRNKLNVTDAFESVFALYTVTDGCMDPNQMYFVFLLPDGTAHRLDYYCGVDDFITYRLTTEDQCMNYINSSAERKTISLN